MKDMTDQLLLFYHENEKLMMIITGAVIFLVFFLFRNKLSKALVSIINKLFFKNDTERSEALFKAVYRPSSLFFVILGLFLSLYLNMKSAALLTSFKIAVILIFCWIMLNYLSGNLFRMLHVGGDQQDKINVTAVRFISNICKVIIAAFAVVMVISELGYNINGLITGIGVSGLAVSLAAQDAVSNLISGFVIVLEKPFKVGDFVKLNDVTGTVDDVVMRSTRIRTLDDTLVTIPNSAITGAPIINYSRINHRLIDVEYGVTYDTPNALLEKCMQDIRDYLNKDEEILPAPIRVELEKLDDSSLTINVFCYATTADIHEYKRILTKVNLRIKSIIEENGASFAFPSTSVYIEKK